LHKPLADFVQTTREPLTPKGMVIVPRGHYKTTIGGEGFPIWCWIKDKNDTIILGSATDGMAVKMGRAVRQHFDGNNLFRWVWSDLLPPTGRKWTDHELEINRDVDVKEPSLFLIGVGGTAVGLHFRRMIKDDLVNEDHLISQDQMQKPIDWHKYSLSLLINPERDTELINGTRWAYSDFVSYVQDNEPQFRVFWQAATQGGKSIDDPEAEPIFPEEFSLNTLRMIRDRQGPYIFSCQYMNDPVDPARAIIQKDWINYIEDLEKLHDFDYKAILERSMCYVIVDPALSKERHGDYTGYVVCFVDHNYDVYIEEAKKLRIGVHELMDLLFNLVNTYNPTMVGIEMASLLRALEHPLETEMTKRGKFFYVKALQPSNKISKEMRIRASLQPIFARRKVFIRKSQKALEEQLIKYPFINEDDIIDALAYLPHIWVPGDQPGPEYTDEEKASMDPMNIEYILNKLTRGNMAVNYPFVQTSREVLRAYGSYHSNVHQDTSHPV
jgi:hypothetical protein